MGVAARILIDARAPSVFVGDSLQQVNAWRYAVNTLKKVPEHKRFELTGAFRFGEGIAEVVNRVTSNLTGERLIIRGLGNPSKVKTYDSLFPPLKKGWAYISRTNGGVVRLPRVSPFRAGHIVCGSVDTGEPATYLLTQSTDQITEWRNARWPLVGRRANVAPRQRESLMRRVAMLVLLIALGLPAAANAQDWSPEQTEVWDTVVAQWAATRAKDHTWPERTLHPSFLGWTDTYPMPRDKEGVKAWERYDSEGSQVHAQELNPVGIVVEGSTAVVHYYYSTAAEDRDGKHKTTHGRYTDVLVKHEGKWLFIAWHGGDDPRMNE
jgi:hypothetical protein